MGEGQKTSVKVPARMRAMVEVMATMEMWVVEEVVASAYRSADDGVRVPIMVPKLLMNASPGPDTKKNPAAVSHMV